MITISLKEKGKNIAKAVKEALERLAEAQVDLTSLLNEMDNIGLSDDKPNDKQYGRLNKRVVIYLNAGHGGLHPETGAYMTFPSDGKFYEFVDRQGDLVQVAYEGVLNRLYATLLEKKLLKAGFKVVKTYHEYNDMLNADRADIANNHYLVNKVFRSCWVSIHFNAHGKKSRGLSIDANGSCYFTLNGQNESDKIAALVWAKFKEYTKKWGIYYREDWTDGDADFEARFQEFNLTYMPAYLHEVLFFTNWNDFQLAQNGEFMQACTDAHLEGLLEYFNSL